jgi:hypothetical protein
MNLSSKGQSLIALYETMATGGYDRTDGIKVEVAFSDFELRSFRKPVRTLLRQHDVRTVLDYGCGGSSWSLKGFDDETGESAIEYFGLSGAAHYEPARGIDERRPVDCVVSFDVLEHIFISDIPATLRDMFSYAGRLLVLNIACYPAAARLPNGENAHITVRPPLWWKGMIDGIASEYPHVSVFLGCSLAYRKLDSFEVFSGDRWLTDPQYVINY